MQPPEGLDPIRVLVVDDQELFRRGLALVLSGEPGVQLVGEAADGEAALDLVARSAPDVVLLDARLPKMAGMDICAAIQGAAPATRIVMLMSSSEEADLSTALRRGAWGCLLKDAAIDEVAQVVRHVASREPLLSAALPDAHR